MSDALAKNLTRVIDLFREWDDDNTGTVSREEFHRAMRELGCELPLADVDALLNTWDPDKSGSISIEELNRVLRQKVELDASLRAGAAGAIELQADQKIAVRKKVVRKEDATLLQGLDIDEASEKSVAQQVCGAHTAAPCGPCAPLRQRRGSR